MGYNSSVKGVKGTLLFFSLAMLAMTPSEGKNRTGGREIPVERERLLQHVKALTDISPPRNYLNTPSLDKAARYIEETFAKSGGRLEIQEFTVEGRAYRNVIASFGPEEAEWPLPTVWTSWHTPWRSPPSSAQSTWEARCTPRASPAKG
jgi:hypothetical protein